MVATLAALALEARSISKAAGLCAEQIVSPPAGPDDDGEDAALVDQWGRLLALAAVSVIGREPGAGGVAVLEASVSRRHAELRRVPGGEAWSLADLGSTNGTFLDGKRLVAGVAAPLADGALIVVGDVGFVFVADRGERLAGQVTESIRATAASRAAGGAGAGVAEAAPGLRLMAHPGGAGGVAHGPGGTVQLASTQFALLALLAARAAEEAAVPEDVRGFVRSIEIQASLPWDTPHPEDNHVKQLVRRLRRALERGGLPGAIESRHGFGYRLQYPARLE